MFASFSIPGTAFNMASIVTAPEVYADCVPLAAAPAIVPPVARIATSGLSFFAGEFWHPMAMRTKIIMYTRFIMPLSKAGACALA